MIKTLLGFNLALFSLFAPQSWGAPQPKFYPGVESVESCPPPAKDVYFGPEFCDKAHYLLKNIVALEDAQSVLSDKQVVLLGDTHPNRLIKDWIVRNLENIKAVGFTHIGLEALNSEDQDLLDQYKEDPALRSRVLQTLTKEWGWIPEVHLDLIDAIFESGLQIVALDNRNSLNPKDEDKHIELRNLHMAQVIASNIKKTNSGRMLVLTGKVHSTWTSLDNPNEITLPRALELEDLQSVSLDMETEELLVPSKVTQAFSQYLQKNEILESSSGDYFLKLPASAHAQAIIFITR